MQTVRVNRRAMQGVPTQVECEKPQAGAMSELPNSGLGPRAEACG